jgi:uncharacterized protein
MKMIIKDIFYGEYEFDNVFEEIINSPTLQRLKGIHQNGADFLVDKNRKATRYEHSIGVMLLIRKLNGSKKEQIAGLLHDISHTAFSHTIDTVMNKSNNSYHEIIKDEYINRSEVISILKKYNYDPLEIMDEKNFSILEKDAPDLCADRLDYMFRDLYNLNMITLDEINYIIDNLVIDKEIIKCKDKKSAMLIFDKYIYLYDKVFNDDKNEVANIILSFIIKRLMEEKIIREKDLLKDDSFFIDIIKKSKYKNIFDNLNKNILFTLSDRKTDYYIKRKARKVDPLIICIDKRITQISKDAKNKLDNYINSIKTDVYYDIPILT